MREWRPSRTRHRRGEDCNGRIQRRSLQGEAGTRDRSSSTRTGASARDWPGLVRAHIIETGEGGYCIIAEWEDMASLAAAREAMIATLDSFRDTLEELGPGAE